VHRQKIEARQLECLIALMETTEFVEIMPRADKVASVIRPSRLKASSRRALRFPVMRDHRFAEHSLRAEFVREA
jgi:hypothetical protein